MNARQQLARVVPLAVLVLLAAVGLRGGIPGLRWSGPLRAYGVVIGIVVEAICVVLLVLTYYRDHVARRQQFEALRGQAGAAPQADADADDRDVAQSLRFHLRLLLASAIIAVAVALLLNLHLHMFTGRSHEVIKLPPRLPTKTLRPLPRQVAAPSTAVHSVLYVLLIAVLLAVLAVSIWWARRLRISLSLPAPPAIPGDATEDESQGLREAVASGRAAMADLDDARAAIIACYEAMEQSLAEQGAARGVAGTPDELLSRATDRNLIRGDAARRLTRLFYEARFSSHRLGVDARDAAAGALDELAAELGGVAR